MVGCHENSIDIIYPRKITERYKYTQITWSFLLYFHLIHGKKKMVRQIKV